MRPTASSAFAALAVLALSTACGKSQPKGGCTAGAVQACTCPGGANGVQQCVAAGTGYSACACGTPQNDAGSGQDAGNPGTDAGNPGTDGGTPDGGGPMDAGGPVDGGGPIDAGGTVDAGPPDAGSCGDGVLNAGEQCDDGNLLELDGCDSQCRYEMVTRMTTLAISNGTAPSFCTPATNALGKVALTGTALAFINPPLQNDIDAGTFNVMMEHLGLDDLNGVTAATPFTLGILGGALDPRRGTWPGANPVDWWFLADPTALQNGVSTDLVPSVRLSGGTMSAGPSDLTMTLSLSGVPAQLRMLNARINATINANPPPDAPAPPPAQLAAGLTAFQTVTADGANQGLCGNVTVESLANIPIPKGLTTGAAACQACAGTSHVYTYCGVGQPVDAGCNSLLDALVGGCGVIVCLPAINPTQPDVPANGIAVKTLTLGPNNKVPAALTTGDQDAYSTYLTFEANRVHVTGEKCTQSAQCQAGQACSDAGVCQ